MFKLCLSSGYVIVFADENLKRRQYRVQVGRWRRWWRHRWPVPQDEREVTWHGRGGELLWIADASQSHVGPDAREAANSAHGPRTAGRGTAGLTELIHFKQRMVCNLNISAFLSGRWSWFWKRAKQVEGEVQEAVWKVDAVAQVRHLKWWLCNPIFL